LATLASSNTSAGALERATRSACVDRSCTHPARNDSSSYTSSAAPLSTSAASVVDSTTHVTLRRNDRLRSISAV